VSLAGSGALLPPWLGYATMNSYTEIGMMT